MLSALRHAIYIVVDEPRLRAHLLSVLEEKHIPRISALYRHRLTLHLGYCSMIQETHEAMLKSSGGCVRWSTLDSSPQGGVDYLMWGCSTMKQSDLIPAMVLAEQLASSMGDEEEERRVVKLLDPLITLVKAVPSAIGSGRASVNRNAHAFVHSSRLTSMSLRSCSSLANCGVSLTGDLGTESHLPEFRSTLPAMFGACVD